MSSLA